MVNLRGPDAIYLFVHEGLWRSLAAFPVGHAKDIRPISNISRCDQRQNSAAVRLALRSLPSRHHDGQRDLRGIDAHLELHAGRLVAFTSSASLVLDPSDRNSSLALMLPPCTSFQRGVHYSEGYASPISFWGRIATFRWIIPGYDQRCSSSCSPSWPFSSVIALGAFLGIDSAPDRLPLPRRLLVLVALIDPPEAEALAADGPAPPRSGDSQGQQRLCPDGLAMKAPGESSNVPESRSALVGILEQALPAMPARPDLRLDLGHARRLPGLRARLRPRRPGYFTGAMYVSYALAIPLIALLTLIEHLMFRVGRCSAWWCWLRSSACR